MLKRLRIWGILATISGFAIVGIGGCASNGQTSNSDRGAEYSSIKEMVRDILQTEEGKGALREALNDPEIKKSLYISDTEIKTSIGEKLLSPEGTQFLRDTFNDPTFIAEYAKVTAQEHAKLLKDLMKDPDYQKLVLATLKSPDFSQQIIHTLQSSDFRSVVKETAQEVLEGPLFQENIAKMVKSQVEQQAKSQQQQSGKEEQKKQGTEQEEGQE